MEWEAPGIILDTRPYGEGDAIVAVLTAAHGRHRGLARGGRSRGRAGTWQPGNVVQVRWVGRLPDHLGSMTGELIHAAAAAALEDPLALALLRSACAIADAALPEQEPHPRALDALLALIARLGDDSALAEYVRWEVLILAELGYGLDLGACAVTGGTSDLAYVSPRTGRAVSSGAAGAWASRLLPLPAFLVHDETPTADAVRAGLAVTEHFLFRDVFGTRHVGLPAARTALAARVASMTEIA